MRIGLPILCLAVSAGWLLAACGDDGPAYRQHTDFNGFAREISQSLAAQDVERLVLNTSRITVTCDELLAEEDVCRGRAVGSVAEAYDVNRYGTGGEPELLDGAGIRRLLEGMLFGNDLTASPDEFGGPGITVYSTRMPDLALWFENDDPNDLPLRGDIAITYLGTSPSEDSQIQRRLWMALAEQGVDDVWRIRLWVVGFPPADHPALNPSEENGFTRWPPPEQ